MVQWGRVASLAGTGLAAFIAGIFVHRFYRMLRPSDPAIAGVALALAKAKMSIAGKRYPAKMVFVVRNDLKMGKGKMCAQCGHATSGIILRLVKDNKWDVLENWRTTGQAKIALKVDSEAEMLSLQQKAQSMGLPTYLVVDAGRTQIQSGSKTVLAIGPGPISDIDQVTGHMLLL